MRIALISDSHGHLPHELWEHLEDCDEILHLGDLGSLELLADLAAIAPTFAVGGNVDPPGLRELPPRRELERLGLTLRLRHEPWSARELAGDGIYLHGHTHIPRVERSGSSYIVCPGSVSRPRGQFPASLGTLDLMPDRSLLRLLPIAGGIPLAELTLLRP